MDENHSSSLDSSAAATMDFHHQQDKKDVSKVFASLRSKLNAKEKELLELQRAEPCLLAPDYEQIQTLIDVISSLHLSTQDGSFVFASNSNKKSSSTTTSQCSTGIETIKTLPSNVWLSETISSKQQHESQYRLPMVTHLLSLPVNAYIASSSNQSKVSLTEKKDRTEPSNRLPMVSQLLSMPINAFTVASSNNQSIPSPPPPIIEQKQETVMNDNTESSKSIFDTEKIYSKEHWLTKSSQSESHSLDLDTYIEQTTEKMRRLHMEYIQALEKLKTPTQPVDSPTAIKTIYPEIFNRNKQDTPTTKRTRIFPSDA